MAANVKNTKEITQEQLDRAQAELNEVYREITENNIAIEDARSQGDLSENEDYKSAREKQKVLFDRRDDLESFIRNSKVSDIKSENNLGKLIKVEYLDDKTTEEFVLLGEGNVRPFENEISTSSPLGKLLYKAEKGQKLTVITEDNDRFEVKVLDIKNPNEAGKTKKHAK